MTESLSKSNERPVRKPTVSRSRRGMTFDGDTPRPMTALTHAMLDRRRRAAGPSSCCVARRRRGDPDSPAVLVTADGKVSYALTARQPGLQVERSTYGRTDLQVSQTLFFSDRDAFDRWCDTDPIRFQQPLLHEQLKQTGGELLHELRTGTCAL
jgi:hypothetical protein